MLDEFMGDALLKNWRDILKKAWSIRLILLAAVLSGMEVALALGGDLLPIPRGSFALLSGVVGCAAFAARLLAQRNLNDGA